MGPLHYMKPGAAITGWGGGTSASNIFSGGRDIISKVPPPPPPPTIFGPMMKTYMLVEIYKPILLLGSEEFITKMVICVL